MEQDEYEGTSIKNIDGCNGQRLKSLARNTALNEKLEGFHNARALLIVKTKNCKRNILILILVISSVKLEKVGKPKSLEVEFFAKS